MTVAFDLQPVQSRWHGERGIARYTIDLATALERHHPDAASHLLLNPDLPTSERVSQLPREKLAWNDARPRGVDVYHVTSPFELGLPLDQIWPAWARAGCRLVVTLYDVIPLLFPEHYTQAPNERSHYQSRLELVRRADKVLTISDTSASDATRLLGLRPRQVEVVGAAPAPAFSPSESVASARRHLAESHPAIRDGYVLYTGGVDWRKNIHGLIVAYAQLPERLRRAHQLVIVCSVGDQHLIRFQENIGALGIADQVVFAGRVSDDDLVRLYQATELFVFPSLYEGYGLPVAEALSCGAPVICSRSSSLTELIDDDEALFDPNDPSDIASTMRAGLEDATRRERLRRQERPLGHTWEAVASATAAAYADLRTRAARRRPRLPRLAVVSPLPPTTSGVADYTEQLLHHLREWYCIDVFVEDDELGRTADLGRIAVHGVSCFEQVEALRNGFDRVLYCIGNQTTHVAALELLPRRPGMVLTHDLRLTGLYAWCAQHRRDLVPSDFRELLHRLHPTDLPADLGERGFLDYREADAFGILMARAVIQQSTRFLTHSDAARDWARRDASEECRARIESFPFAFPDVVPRQGQPVPPLVATFGVADPIKQTPKVLEAFAVLSSQQPDVRLAIVGPMPEVVQSTYLERAAELGVRDRVTVTGRVSRDEYHDWLQRSTVALQLRASWGGEASAAVADCLAHGVPTIVTATGWTVGLPDAAVIRVDVDVTPEELAGVTADLLGDEGRQRRLSAAAQDHAAAHSFRRVAEELYERMSEDEPDWLGHRPSAATRPVATSATE